jgi:hypothetical protein
MVAPAIVASSATAASGGSRSGPVGTRVFRSMAANAHSTGTATASSSMGRTSRLSSIRLDSARWRSRRTCAVTC